MFWVRPGLDYFHGLLAASEEGQRPLAQPHSLVQFLGSFINGTAEQSLLSPNSTMAWLSDCHAIEHTDHTETKISYSTQRITTNYSHHKIWPTVVQPTAAFPLLRQMRASLCVPRPVLIPSALPVLDCASGELCQGQFPGASGPLIAHGQRRLTLT